MIGRRALALPAALLLAWGLFSLTGGLDGFDLIAGIAAAGVGILAAAAWPAVTEAATRALAVTEDLLGDGPGAPHGAEPGLGGLGDDEGDVESLEPEQPGAAMGALLERLRASLDADRLLLWRVDRDADQVAAVQGTGPTLPAPTPAEGSPLAWASGEGTALRLDPAPRWARGAAVAAPVDDERVMTVETPALEPADPKTVAGAATLLAPFLALHDRQEAAVAATARVERVIGFLRSLPRAEDSVRLPESLVQTAVDIAGGRGGLVAMWTGEAGEVLAVDGPGGGPPPGTTFGTGDGDLAHAARTRTTVRREPGGPAWPALASGDERWERPPPLYRTVLPLVDPHDDTAGLLAVWGRSALSETGTTLLEALGPLLALQIRQATELERFRTRATADALTGLPNRAALEDRMEETRARFHRYRRPMALLVLDLDHFKHVNDTYGHDAGDEVLRRVAEALRGAVREVDFPARFGGEEMVVLLPETLLHAALDVAERVRAAVEALRIEHDGRSIPVTASIGVSACPECVDDPADLFGSADEALYASKDAGRNRVTAAPTRAVSGGAGG